MLFPISKALLERLQPLSHLKLQKLVYITFGLHAGKRGNHLFEDRIEAWKYGPVIPKLYQELKTFRDKRFTLEEVKSEKISRAKQINDEAVLDTINTVNRIYGKKDALSLVEYTHGKNTPWSQVYDGQRSKEIPKDAIKMYYRNMFDIKAFLDSYKPVFEALAKT